ncbi:energy transducer TonB [Maribacter polysiphoniae]|uniref:Protein TonB n=2 Tax=Maribacter polysiphoniae TaxID=429344 RepID=A0A316EH11_9FLAO|nr:energy transducer TonB [Maribacter polysiphoniae]PWK22270.1 protein TonB [Maribacter polysiphoniae]
MMKPKKHPKRDLNKNSGLYFVIGLILVMACTYMAFEWKTYDRPNYYGEAINMPDDPLEELPPIITLDVPPPPPEPVIPDVIEIVINEDPIIETVVASSESNPDKEILEVKDIDVIDDPVDMPPVPFSVIEEVPVFPGCEKAVDKRACFQDQMNRHIRKNFRYPEIPLEMGIQGKVYMQFMIETDGSIGHIQKRGPDKHLEAEATRIIKLLPKMQPGKQRGTPVKVPFSIPINFKLQ